MTIQLSYTDIDSKKRSEIKSFLKEKININPELMDKDGFYESLLKKYPNGLDEVALMELREMAIYDPNSFYHINGYDFNKKLSVEREMLEKEITR